MASVTVDVITRGLDETIQNLGEFGNIITDGVAIQYERWYNEKYKKSVLEVIATGQPVSKIPLNTGQYAIRKRAGTLPGQSGGINHGLGRITGKLYNEVAAARITIKKTRGKEVRLAIYYNAPFYIVYVIEGTKWNNKVRRPFPEVARSKSLPALYKMLGNMIEGLDLTQPTPKLISTILTPVSIR